MITDFLYNTMIEFFILMGIILWFIIGCTFFIPLLYNAADGDYWDISSFIKDMRLGKIKYK